MVKSHLSLLIGKASNNERTWDIDRIAKIFEEKELSRVTHIVGSDLIFNSFGLEYVPKILTTLTSLYLSHSLPTPEFIFSHKSRHDAIDDVLASTFLSISYSGTQVPECQHSSVHASPLIDIFILEHTPG